MDPRKVREVREKERANLAQDMRRTQALEDIADTLESIRVILLDIARSAGRIGTGTKM